MLRLFLFFLFFFFQKLSLAQFASITVESANILYAGIANPITAVAENTSCGELVVKTTNGIIGGKHCLFTYTIDFDSITDSNNRSTQIEIYKKTDKGLKLLASRYFKIEKIPDPLACIVSCGIFKIIKYHFRERTFSDGHPQPPDMRAEVPFFDNSLKLRYRFVVDSFHFSIYRNDSILVNSFFNKGNFFSKTTYEAFKVLNGGDRIVFDKIFAKGSDGSHRQLKPVIIDVTN